MTDKLSLGDTPEQLNTKCANWVDVLVVDDTSYDKNAVAKLLAERDALAAKLAKIARAWADAGGWPDTAEEMDAIADAISSEPMQCLRDVQAEAVMQAVQFFKPSRDIDVEALEAYAATVRQGGAE